MTTPSSPVDSIAKAMEVVTLEEWIVNGDRFSVETNATYIPDQKVIALCATGDGSMDRALYIAACNPVAITALLDLARQAEAMKREMAELRRGLNEIATDEEYRDLSAEEAKDMAKATLRRARALIGGGHAEE